MADDGRCACGSRIFFDLNTRITCEDGRAFSIPSPQISVCVSCGATVKFVGVDGEKKSVVPWKAGPEGERELFLSALEHMKNDHPNAPNRDFITITEADQKDFERHGIPRPEVVTK